MTFPRRPDKSIKVDEDPIVRRPDKSIKVDEDPIVLTLTEYIEWMKGLDQQIDSAYEAAKEAEADWENDLIESDVHDAADELYTSLVEAKKQGVLRMQKAKVIRPEAKFAMDVAEGMLEELE